MASTFAFTPFRNAALALACAALSACSWVLLPPNEQHVAPPSASVEEAGLKLQQASARRTAIEAEFAASEQLCYDKFFVNNCLDNAKEKRRSELAIVRSIEIEAELFQRRAKADARDRALAEALQQDQAEAAERAANPRPVRDEEPAPPARRPMKPKVNREAANAARLKRIAEQEKADEGKRAESAARFEAKRVESERRQAERAKRQAERAAEKN